MFQSKQISKASKFCNWKQLTTAGRRYYYTEEEAESQKVFDFVKSEPPTHCESEASLTPNPVLILPHPLSFFFSYLAGSKAPLP